MCRYGPRASRWRREGDVHNRHNAAWKQRVGRGGGGVHIQYYHAGPSAASSDPRRAPKSAPTAIGAQREAAGAARALPALHLGLEVGERNVLAALLVDLVE